MSASVVEHTKKSKSQCKGKMSRFFSWCPARSFDESVRSVVTGHLRKSRVFRNHRSVKIPYYFQNFKCSISKLSAENCDMRLSLGLTGMIVNGQSGHRFIFPANESVTYIFVTSLRCLYPMSIIICAGSFQIRLFVFKAT